MFKNKFIVISFLLMSVLLFAGCANTTSNDSSQLQTETNTIDTKSSPPVVEFTGIKGESLVLADGNAKVESKVFDDNKAHYYNTKLDNGEVVYFFIVKDKNGIYRAAGNACQVCAQSKMGFRQEGDYMVCNTCGNKYPMEKIATEKGGCNPVPVNPNLKIVDNKVVVEASDLKQLIRYFGYF